ncbi:MAG: hypothetical protein ACPL1F_05135, partial [bacterium]
VSMMRGYREPALAVQKSLIFERFDRIIMRELTSGVNSSTHGTVYKETYTPEVRVFHRLKSSSAILPYGRIGRSRGSVNLPVVIRDILECLNSPEASYL